MKLFYFPFIALLAGCNVENNEPTDEQGINTSSVIKFEIAPERRDCVGVVPMRCLVVNGEYFYDTIQGYHHVEGQAAVIWVQQRLRPDPTPTDVGSYTYHQIPNPE